MTREEILAAAKQCVCGGRETDYGTPEDSFGLIGHRAHDYGEGCCHDDGAAENRTNSGQPGNGRLLR